MAAHLISCSWSRSSRTETGTVSTQKPHVVLMLVIFVQKCNISLESLIWIETYVNFVASTDAESWTSAPRNRCVGGGSKYKFKDSSTAYVGTSGGCNCFYYLGVMPSGRLIRCHGSHSSGYSCAVKSCSSDSDCSGYTMDGRATYCGQASSEAGNKKWCVPKVNVKENSCTIR